MSIHTDRAFDVAQGKGAAAACDRDTWNALIAMPKRELAEIAMHLAALAADSYDDALRGGDALAKVLEEREFLYENGLI